MKKIAPVILILILVTGAYFLMKVRRQGIAGNIFSGTIEATEVDIRTEVGGRILDAGPEEGSLVKEGYRLIKINDEKLKIQLSMAEAEYQANVSRHKLLKKGPRREERSASWARRTQAKAQMDQASLDLNRTKQLLEEQVISQDKLDQARTQYKVAKENFNMARKEYMLVKAGAREEEIDAQGALVDAASAQIDLLKSQIADTEIFSPITGTVLERYVEKGELVTPGTLIGTIADLTRVKLTIYVPEDKVGKVKLNDTVKVRMDSYPGKVYDGRIKKIADQAEFTPKNIQTKDERVKLVFGVEIALDNSSGELKPGLPADAELSSFETESKGLFGK